MRARVGKIARLPANIREQLNRRIHDGESGAKLIAWLHSRPDVLEVLDEYFNEEPISMQNLSEWRKGGYREWLERNERIAQTKALADYCLKVAQSGGHIMDGGAAIVAGKLFEALEDFDPAKLKAALEADGGEASLPGLINALARLQATHISKRRADLAQQQTRQAQRRLELDEERFRRETAEMVLKHADDARIKAVAASDASREVKLQEIARLMFGSRPKEASRDGA